MAVVTILQKFVESGSVSLEHGTRTGPKSAMNWVHLSGRFIVGLVIRH